MRLLSAHVNRLFLVYCLVTGVLAFAIALSAPAGTDPVSQFAWMTAASIVAAGLLVVIARMWTASAVYAVVFWCFHFGLVAAVAVHYLPTIDLALTEVGWIVGPFAAEAARLALAGLLAFASGATLVHACRRRPEVLPPHHATHPYGPVGSVLVFAGIASWCAVVVIAGGASGFFASYESFRDMTANYSLPISIISPALACGIVIAVTGKPGLHRTAAISAFATFALVALPIGLRTDVMFPAVALIVASARCGKSFSPLKAAALGLGLLFLIPVVKEVRNTGLGAVPDVLAAPRLDALVEMGGSLRPVEQVVRWHAEGDPFLLGGSYWAPFERAAARLLPDLRSSAADDDLRLMNVLVMDRIGAIGFSPVAEAYRNFGAIGVVIVMALIGIALAAIDTIRDPRRAVLAIAVFYPPLLINIRNSFVAVPVQCLAGIALLLGVAALRHMLNGMMTRPYANSPYVRSQI